MNKVSLTVYDRDLNELGVIDNYSSLRWRSKYFEYGEFELHINNSINNRKLLAKDNIIKRSDLSEDEEVGIIETWKFNDDGEKVSIVVYGSFGLSLLERRIIKTRINYSGDFIGGFRKLLTTMRPFKKLDIIDSDIASEKVEYQCTYKNVYEFHKKLSKASNIAGKIVADLKNKRFKYINYEGKDRTEIQKNNARYEFSESESNIATSDYSYSSISEINDVLIGGVGEGVDRVIRTITQVTEDTHDFDIKEAFVDAKNESKDDLTEDEYNAILDNLGTQKLTGPTESYEFKVKNTIDYRTKWNLGDIVNIKKESWGIDERKRITEVEEIFERGKYEVIPTFGTPISEKFENEED